jgi:hypothetical protein
MTVVYHRLRQKDFMKKKRPRASANRPKSKPVSLTPNQVQFVEKRAAHVGGLSRYFQMLVDFDRKNDVVPDGLKRVTK